MVNEGEDTFEMLIDDNNRWDVQKVWSMFNPQVAANILKIKLGSIMT